MRVVRDLGTRLRKPLCLAMGVFDGLHRGHREVIGAAVRNGERLGITPAVLTFDPHPDAVLSPRGAPPLLTTTEEKLALLQGLGVQLTVLAGFDRRLANMPAEEFVRELLVGRLRARCLAVGEGWRFGAAGKGATSLLREMAPELGFGVSVVPPVSLDGAKVSSTRIRSLLARGCTSAAAKLLGDRYRVTGEVVAGAGLGRRLGYPTANLALPEEKLIPADGIYACLAGLRRLRPAITYIGARPTVSTDGTRGVEVHVLPLKAGERARRRLDLLGRVLRVEFVERLRGDRKFPSLEALSRQMACDCKRAQALLTALQP